MKPRRHVMGAALSREIEEWWVAEAIDHYRQCEQLQTELAARLGSAELLIRSPDESVEVRVRGDGTVQRVTVLGSLEGRSSGELSRAIDGTVNAAADAARWASRTLLAELLASRGPGYPTIRTGGSASR